MLSSIHCGSETRRRTTSSPAVRSPLATGPPAYGSPDAAMVTCHRSGSNREPGDQVVPNGAVSGAPRLDVHELHMKPPNERHRGWTVHPDLAAATATGSKCVVLVYQSRRDGGTARDDGLRGRRSGVHRRRQAAVHPAGAHRQRAALMGRRASRIGPKVATTLFILT